MIIELSDFFNNPSLIELGPLKIQYYAITWLISAVLIYIFLKNNNAIKEIKSLIPEDVNVIIVNNQSNDTNKTPKNLEAEQGLIGSILFDNTVLETIVDINLKGTMRLCAECRPLLAQ